MENRFKSYEELEAVKLKAIDTLSKVDEDSLLDVCYCWAGILKRRVWQPTLRPEDMDDHLREIESFMNGEFDIHSSCMELC